MNKILITGSTGDVGKKLSKFLLKKKYNVLCLVRGEKKGPHEINGDLTDYNSLSKATENVKIVIHVAGVIKGSKQALRDVNIEGTRNLIRACEGNSVEKIVFISTLDLKFFNTPYSESKKKAEDIIINSNLNYIILRPSVIYGEDFHKDLSTLVKLLKNVPLIPIIGSGKNLYQPIYVHDLIVLIKEIIDTNDVMNKAFYVCGAEPISFNELIDLICYRLSKKVVKLHIPDLIVTTVSLFTELFRMNINLKNFTTDKICSNEEIKKSYDFNPISVKEGINKLV